MSMYRQASGYASLPLSVYRYLQDHDAGKALHREEHMLPKV